MPIRSPSENGKRGVRRLRAAPLLPRQMRPNLQGTLSHQAHTERRKPVHPRQRPNLQQPASTTKINRQGSQRLSRMPSRCDRKTRRASRASKERRELSRIRYLSQRSGSRDPFHTVPLCSPRKRSTPRRLLSLSLTSRGFAKYSWNYEPNTGKKIANK